MTDWYKMDPIDWNDGTDDLTLEQEGAYLRICNAIYISGRPIRDNGFVVAGLFRCNERRAKRLLLELVEAGKITVENGLISNRRAIDEVSNRDRIRMERKSAGSRGGVNSGNTRRNALKSNEMGEAIASTSDEPDKIRVEETVSKEPAREKFGNPIIALQSVLDPLNAKRFADHCAGKGRKLSVETAEMIAADLREFHVSGGNPVAAIDLAIKRGWTAIDLEWLRNAGLKSNARPGAPLASPNEWTARITVFRQSRTWNSSWGPMPGDPGCEVPPEFLREHAA